MNTIEPACVTALRRFCEAWGGRLICLSESKFTQVFKMVADEDGLALPRSRALIPRDNDQFDIAPATKWHGVHYGIKTVFVVPERASANGIIHEMGHVFATLNPPSQADELDFLGWEICLARAGGFYRAWSLGNGTYGLGGVSTLDEWESASAARKAEVARESIARGIAIGSIEPLTLAPRSVR
jgi:hypothetical protein